MRLIPVECVKPNCFLARTIYDDDGKILLREGATLTEKILKKIKDMQIYSFYIIDEYSDKEISDIISPELRQKSVQLVKDIFENSEHIKLANVEISSLDSNETFDMLKKKEDYLDSLRDLSSDICQNILNNKDVSVGLVDIKTMDSYTYQHSVNVATLSVVLGISIALPKSELVELCIGALLHDIGKVFVGKKIVQKPTSLTGEELEIIKAHPRLGYEYIKKIPNIKTSSKMIVLQHHERIDGTGYPDALIDEDIHILAKIVSIADVYDALTSDRPYKRAMCPSDAFKFILSKAGSMFDMELTKIFSEIMVPYPEGTLIRLSTNAIAIVTKTHPFYPLRPTVKILKDFNSNLIGKHIDLSDVLSITITEIVYDIE